MRQFPRRHTQKIRKTTYDHTLNDITAAKTITNLDLILLRRTDVLRPDYTRELFASRQWNTIDDGDGDHSLLWRESRHGTENY